MGKTFYKLTLLDIKAKDGLGRLYNIEMQVQVPKFWHKRALYYASKLYSTQLESGHSYEKLKKTISISILDEVAFPEYKELYNLYRFQNTRTSDFLEDLIELHFIDLPKFNANKEGEKIIKLLTKSKTLKDDVLNNIDMLKAWTLFLKKPTSQGIRDLEDKVSEIKEAKKELREVSADEKNRILYEMRENTLRDKISALNSATRKGIEKGLKKAQKQIDKAQKEKEKAKKEKEKVQKEKNELLKISIKALLSANMPVSKIAETLRVSKEIINKLK